mmetsp:Transcript_32427/g.49608  ORF Transcript_32427/g.49608 Transcript_32427/m.49608 type:complete len:89 (+) Transcript_32427:579-845(+)
MVNGKKRLCCKKCMVYVEEDMEHCDDCQVCVSGMDHHCVFFSKCIGGGNIAYFWASIGLLIVNFILMAVIMTFGMSKGGGRTGHFRAP